MTISTEELKRWREEAEKAMDKWGPAAMHSVSAPCYIALIDEILELKECERLLKTVSGYSFGELLSIIDDHRKGQPE